jgi:hypothetical protein
MSLRAYYAIAFATTILQHALSSKMHISDHALCHRAFELADKLCSLELDD